jgi:DNA topoisomerase I
VETYCVKCREKQEMLNPEPAFNKAGAPVTKGVCSVCGTKMNRMGRTPAHEGMAPSEEIIRSEKRLRGEMENWSLWNHLPKPEPWGGILVKAIL